MSSLPVEEPSLSADCVARTGAEKSLRPENVPKKKTSKKTKKPLKKIPSCKDYKKPMDSESKSSIIIKSSFFSSTQKKRQSKTLAH